MDTATSTRVRFCLLSSSLSLYLITPNSPSLSPLNQAKRARPCSSQRTGERIIKPCTQMYEELIARQAEQIASLESELAKANAQQPQEITCSICMENMTTSGSIPARICTHGHYICANPCLSRFVCNSSIDFFFHPRTNMPTASVKSDSTTACPTCREVTSDATILAMDPGDHVVYQLLGDRRAPCPYPDCDQTLSGRAYACHILTCDHRTYPCAHCGSDIRHDGIETHLIHDCQNLPCRFCVDGPRHTYAALQSHMELHSRHQDIWSSLRRRIGVTLDIVNTGNEYRYLSTNNVPVPYDILQEALHLNMVLHNFETHYTNQTHGSLRGDEHLESELIEALHIVPGPDEDSDETDEYPIRDELGEGAHRAIHID